MADPPERDPSEPDHADVVIELTLDATNRAPSEARHRIARWMSDAGCGRSSVTDASIVVSELVTNAVHHARSAPTVVARRAANHIVIEVHDNDPSPPVVRPDPDAGGFGLRLVAGLATRWGWAPSARGKVVWAELPPR